MVLGKKNPDPGSGFSENPENPILEGNHKIFLQKTSNFHVKSRNNGAKRLYKSSNILSSEEEGQSHFQKRRRGAAPTPR